MIVLHWQIEYDEQSFMLDEGVDTDSSSMVFFILDDCVTLADWVWWAELHARWRCWHWQLKYGLLHTRWLCYNGRLSMMSFMLYEGVDTDNSRVIFMLDDCVTSADWILWSFFVLGDVIVFHWQIEYDDLLQDGRLCHTDSSSVMVSCHVIV